MPQKIFPNNLAKNLFLICITAVIAYIYLRAQYTPPQLTNTPAPSTQTTPPAPTASPTADTTQPSKKLSGDSWQVYSDENVTFSYPKTWAYTKKYGGLIPTLTSPDFKTKVVGEAGEGGAETTLATQGMEIQTSMTGIGDEPFDYKVFCQPGGTGVTTNCGSVTVNGTPGYTVTSGTVMPEGGVVYDRVSYLFKKPDYVISISFRYKADDAAAQELKDTIYKTIMIK